MFSVDVERQLLPPIHSSEKSELLLDVIVLQLTNHVGPNKSYSYSLKSEEIQLPAHPNVQ